VAHKCEALRPQRRIAGAEHGLPLRILAEAADQLVAGETIDELTVAPLAMDQQPGQNRGGHGMRREIPQIGQRVAVPRCAPDGETVARRLRRHRVGETWLPRRARLGFFVGRYGCFSLHRGRR
jgi:hypothetical protein